MLDDEKQELLALEEERHYRAARENAVYFAETIEIPAVEPTERSFTQAYPIHAEPAAHHRLILTAFQDMITGKLGVDGLIIMAPPGSAKSTYASVVCPAWVMGHRPGCNVMAISYSSELAEQWGYRVRQIVKQPIYQDIFPGADLAADQRAVSSWSLANGSTYRANGVFGSNTGFRADVLIGDDLLKGKEEADSDIIPAKLMGAVKSDLLTRLKPRAKIMLIGTRWIEDDPIGNFLGEDWKGQSGRWRGTDGRMWFVLNLPTKAEHVDDPLGRKPGEMIWPEWFIKEEIDRIEAQGGREWSAMHQQRPAAMEGAILKRSWWRPWNKKNKKGEAEPPECEYIFLSYDTAMEAAEVNDYSAMTAWGIFKAPAEDVRMAGRVIRPGVECFHVILLGAWQERIEATNLFGEIKRHMAIWPDVDMILFEKKASGHALIQEMRRMRWPVKAVTPPVTSGGKQKSIYPRANSIAHTLAEGGVWYIPGAKTHKVLDECTAVPHGRHDDLAMTVLYSLEYFREAYFYQLPSDFEDKDEATLNDMKAYEELRTMRNRRSYDGGTFEFEDNGLEPSPMAKRSGYGQL